MGSALVAIGAGLERVFDWLDKHSGSMTALATIALAVLTGWYVRLIRSQNKLMERQGQLHIDQITEERRQIHIGAAMRLTGNVGTNSESQTTVELMNRGARGWDYKIECPESRVSYPRHPTWDTGGTLTVILLDATPAGTPVRLAITYADDRGAQHRLTYTIDAHGSAVTQIETD